MSLAHVLDKREEPADPILTVHTSSAFMDRWAVGTASWDDGRASGEVTLDGPRATGHLIVKLTAHRVSELVTAGQALRFAPNGRTFREWAAFPVGDPAEWRALLAEARDFAGG